MNKLNTYTHWKFIVICLSLCSTLSAQKQDYNWMMSYQRVQYNILTREMINFEGGKPETHLYWFYDYASNTKAMLSDKAGAFRFFSDGVRLYDRNFDLVEGGEVLISGYYQDHFNLAGYRVDQGAIMLPIGEEEEIVVLIQQDPVDHLVCEQQDCSMQLYFTLIDGRANDGRGKVIDKGVLIMEDTIWSGMVTAMRHANGRDWWVIVWKQDSNEYVSVLVNEAGAHALHREHIGDVMHWKSNGSTQAVFSPDGTKYAHFNPRNGLFLFDFNMETGRLSRFKKWQPEFRHAPGGCVFAPGSRYLYINDNIRMYQLDTWQEDLEQGIHRLPDYDWRTGVLWDWYPKPYHMGQLGPDCKIYYSTGFVDSVFHVIHNPDLGGKNCELEQFSLIVPYRMSFTPPNFPHFRIGEEAERHCEIINTVHQVRSNAGEELKIWPNPATNVIGVGLPRSTDYQHVNVRIYSMTGDIIKTLEQVVQDSGVVIIQVTDLKPGVYLLESTDQRGNRKTARFVLQ